MRRLCAVAIGLGLAVGATPARSETLLFPMPAGIQPQVEFWKRVYTDVDQSGGYLHDSRDLSVIYERLSFPSGLSHRARERRVKAARKRIEATLARLARGHRRGLSAEERRILALFPEDVTATTLRAAAKRVRFQRGQADKFRAGLVRMGRWEGFIRQVLLERGLPAGLVALPHVESSYNPKAYSKVGASGLWQFTRPTGRRYMRVDHVVDERRDPFLSTVAAARLLKHNYELTGSWPLAITAYNHGASGMRRAVRQLGTDDIAEIVSHYKSRSFGFASRNFYTSFLAALEIETQPERYFGEIAKDPPDEPEIVVLDHFYKANSLAQALGLSLEQMREYNPALLGPVWEGRKLVPARYGLRIPRENATPARVTLASIPTGERYAE